MTGLERIARARSACDKDIRYQLGHGGWRPKDALPGKPGPVVLADKHSGCDCSGGQAWIHGIPRDLTIVSGMWGVSTDSIHRDATTAQRFFQLVPRADVQPGDLAVYPDHRGADGKHHEGHVALVVDPGKRVIIDCSFSHKGFSEHVDDMAHFWTRPDAVFCRWRQ